MCNQKPCLHYNIHSTYCDFRACFKDAIKICGCIVIRRKLPVQEMLPGGNFQDGKNLLSLIEFIKSGLNAELDLSGKGVMKSLLQDRKGECS